MNRNLRTAGLCLIALLVMTAGAVKTAVATTSGHFAFPSGTTTLTASEDAFNFHHKVEFAAAGLPATPIYCTVATLHGVVSSATTQSVEMTPTYSLCSTTGEEKLSNISVSFGLCKYVFTSRSSGDATAGLSCPFGQSVQLVDPETGCTLRFFAQHVANAVSYDTNMEFASHSITAKVTATGISYTAHGGLCIFVGTNHTDGTMTGAMTVRGEDTEKKELVGITAT